MSKKNAPREIIMIGLRWFDKINGNTYHTAAALDENREVIATVEPQYGYGNQWYFELERALRAAGMLPEREAGTVIRELVEDTDRERELDEIDAAGWREMWKESEAREEARRNQFASMTLGEIRSLDDVIEYNKTAGYHFFDEDTMLFFDSKAYEAPIYALRTPSETLGVYFVVRDDGPGNVTRVRARRLNPNGSVKTLGGPGFRETGIIADIKNDAAILGGTLYEIV